MTCCPTSHFLRTNASPFEVDKKEDKIGEYWVSQHVAPLKVHRHTVLPDFEFHRNVFGQLDPLPTPTVSEIQLFQCLYIWHLPLDSITITSLSPLKLFVQLFTRLGCCSTFSVMARLRTILARSSMSSLSSLSSWSSIKSLSSNSPLKPDKYNVHRHHHHHQHRGPSSSDVQPV